MGMMLTCYMYDIHICVYINLQIHIHVCINIYLYTLTGNICVIDIFFDILQVISKPVSINVNFF
jgi:hypothetical protein